MIMKNEGLYNLFLGITAKILVENLFGLIGLQ